LNLTKVSHLKNGRLQSFWKNKRKKTIMLKTKSACVENKAVSLIYAKSKLYAVKAIIL